MPRRQSYEGRSSVSDTDGVKMAEVDFCFIMDVANYIGAPTLLLCTCGCFMASVKRRLHTERVASVINKDAAKMTSLPLCLFLPCC